MTQEEKQLLLVDLCARLPYKTKTDFSQRSKFDDLQKYNISHEVGTIEEMYPFDVCNEVKVHYKDSEYYICDIEAIKPYLRPMSSMTEEEKGEYSKLTQAFIEEDGKVEYLIRLPNYNTLDWLNAHYLDYRDLIGKGLALPAPEGMYIIK